MSPQMQQATHGAFNPQLEKAKLQQMMQFPQYMQTPMPQTKRNRKKKQVPAQAQVSNRDLALLASSMDDLRPLIPAKFVSAVPDKVFDLQARILRDVISVAQSLLRKVPMIKLSSLK